MRIAAVSAGSALGCLSGANATRQLIGGFHKAMLREMSGIGTLMGHKFLKIVAEYEPPPVNSPAWHQQPRQQLLALVCARVHRHLHLQLLLQALGGSRMRVTPCQGHVCYICTQLHETFVESLFMANLTIITQPGARNCRALDIEQSSC